MEKNFTDEIIGIVINARNYVAKSANLAHVSSCWLIGQKVFIEEQNGKNRAEYGKFVIETVSNALTEKFGSGYSKTNIKNFRTFYQLFSDFTISQALPDQLKIESVNKKTAEKKYFPSNLSWTHYERLIRVSDDKARLWYMNEASLNQWDYRTLKRNIDSQYFYRLMQTSDEKKAEVKSEMENLTQIYQNKKLEYLKNPVLVEFLGFKRDEAFTENNLEDAIITHLKNFILELGKGYAFVARQQHIKTDMGDYYIDLVFYNYILKCFLLIDLKSEQITHQDVGQMDMYVRMYDELKCSPDDNPTIGLLLCSETSSDLARYSILKDKEQIFQAKYLTYLPTKEQLKFEIEKQKEIMEIKSDTTEL